MVSHVFSSSFWLHQTQHNFRTMYILFWCWCTKFTWLNQSFFAFWIVIVNPLFVSCDISMQKAFSFLSLKKYFTNYFSRLYISFGQFMWEPISQFGIIPIPLDVAKYIVGLRLMQQPIQFVFGMGNISNSLFSNFFVGLPWSLSLPFRNR